MQEHYSQLYVHLVWATWDRLPLITPAIEAALYAAIVEKCRELRCFPVAIGAYHDHVHLLVQLHPTIAVATLAKEVKGASSHLMTHRIGSGGFFKWQGGYSAFTLRKEDVPVAERYIRRQKEHHAADDLCNDWELPVDSGSPQGSQRRTV